MQFLNSELLYFVAFPEIDICAKEHRGRLFLFQNIICDFKKQRMRQEFARGSKRKKYIFP